MFVSVFIFKGGKWQWERNSQQIESTDLTSSVLEPLSSLELECAKVLIASPWRTMPFIPACWGNIKMFCGCWVTEEVGGTALLGIK